MLILNYKLCFSFLHQNGPQISAQHNRLFVSWAPLSYPIQLPSLIISLSVSCLQVCSFPCAGLRACCLPASDSLPLLLILPWPPRPSTQADWGMLSFRSHSPYPRASISTSHRIEHFLLYFPPLETTSSQRRHVCIPRIHGSVWLAVSYTMTHMRAVRVSEVTSTHQARVVCVCHLSSTDFRQTERGVWNTVSNQH